MVDDIRQCPFCELRFQAKWELTAHLDSDHPGRVTEKDRDEGEVIVEQGDPNHPKPL